MKRTGDLKLIKELNRSIILDFIRKEGPISRAEIAKRVNISPTTVTSAVSKLIEERLVIENGVGTSTGGRKPILLQLNPHTCFLIGIAIDASKITIAKLNLHAEVIKKEAISLDSSMYGNISNIILNVISSFFSKLPSLQHCLGISITTQGIVDAANGVILYNPKLQIKNLPLKTMIEAEFEIPTYIDNDTNGNLLAEKGFGKHQTSKNIIYVTIGDGVGAGILVNDTIFRGFHGGAGEFGHTTINNKGPVCDCGNVGCLEKFVGWQGIKEKIVSVLENENIAGIYEKVNGNFTKITPKMFIESVQNKEEWTNVILDDVTSYLGAGLVNLVNLFNPEKIILGGELAFGNDYLINKVKEYIVTHALETHTLNFDVYPSSFGIDFEVVGSASLLLHELFNFTLSE